MESTIKLRHMKRLFIVILSLFFSASCFCQECKFFNEDNVDEMSGLPVLSQKITWKSINKSGFALDVQCFYSTNRCWIHFNVSITKLLYSKGLRFNPETPLVFYFSDSSVLTLMPPKEYNAEIDYEGGISLSSEKTYSVCYSISKEEVEILASRSIDRIRIYYLPPAPLGGNDDSVLAP
jgi:hypothetical protein